MNRSLVAHYVLAFLSAVLRAAVALTLSVALMFAVFSLQDGGPGPALARASQQFATLQATSKWHAATRPAILAAIGAILACGLLTPLAMAWLTVRRHPQQGAGITVPDQHARLEFALPPDEAYALALRVLNEDPAFLRVRGDVAARAISARALPHGSSLRRLLVRPTTAGASPAERALRRFGNLLVELPFLLPRRAYVTIETLPAGVDASAITVRSRWRRWLPAVDPCANNYRNVDALARRIGDLARESLRERREHAERASLERRLLETRLQALQAQVEPHFLYNTLANVQSLVRHDPPAADAMLGHFIDYLRQALPSMRDGGSTVGRELALARAYLDLLAFRMGPRLAYEIGPAGALADHPLPPMMLMTLVENAIKHGLEPLPGGGRVAIDVAADASHVRVSVSDDGAGLGTSHGGGVGLRNLHERLSSLFGERAFLAVEPRPAGGVTATLAVPREPTARASSGACAPGLAPRAHGSLAS